MTSPNMEPMPLSQHDPASDENIVYIDSEEPLQYTPTFSADGQRIHVVPADDALVTSAESTNQYCVLGSREHVLALKKKVQELAKRARELEAEKEEAAQRAQSVEQQLSTYQQELLTLNRSDTAVSTTVTETSSHARKHHHTEHTFGVAKDMEILNPEQEEMERRRRLGKHRRSRAFMAEEDDNDVCPVDCRRFPIDLPRVRQYFHNGILYREEQERKTSWTELFWDLVFVGVIAVLAHEVGANPSATGFAHFSLLFCLIWRIWSDMHIVLNVTASEDVLHRLYLLLEMILVIGMAICCDHAFDSTGITFSIFYFVSRCMRIVMYGLLMLNDRRFFQHCAWNIIMMSISAAIMFGSIFVEEGSSARYVLWWVVVLADAVLNIAVPHLLRHLPESRALSLFSKPEYLIALNIEHMSERMGLFIIIVLGEAIAAILFSRTRDGVDLRFVKAVFGLLLSYSLHLIYFLVDGSRQYLHAIRRHIVTAQLWMFMHLPVSLCLAAGGGALRSIVNYISPTLLEELNINSGSNVSDHSVHAFASATPNGAGGIDSRLIWLFCECYAVALLGLAIIGTLHKSVDPHDDAPRISKRVRITFRIVLAIFWALLPLIPSPLDGYGLHVIVLGVTALLLVLLEAYGRLKKITDEDRKRLMRYIAYMRKKASAKGHALPSQRRWTSQKWSPWRGKSSLSEDESHTSGEGSSLGKKTDGAATVAVSNDIVASVPVEDELDAQQAQEMEENVVELEEAEGIAGVTRRVRGCPGSDKSCAVY